jgi:hypothetical protein
MYAKTMRALPLIEIINKTRKMKATTALMYLKVSNNYISKYKDKGSSINDVTVEEEGLRIL